jgi:hypothetical protein
MHSFVQLHGQRYAAAALDRPRPPHTPAGRLVLEPAWGRCFFLRESELTSVRHSHVFLSCCSERASSRRGWLARERPGTARYYLRLQPAWRETRPRAQLMGDIVLYACRRTVRVQYGAFVH